MKRLTDVNPQMYTLTVDEKKKFRRMCVSMDVVPSVALREMIDLLINSKATIMGDVGWKNVYHLAAEDRKSMSVKLYDHQLVALRGMAADRDRSVGSLARELIVAAIAGKLMVERDGQMVAWGW